MGKPEVVTMVNDRSTWWPDPSASSYERPNINAEY
jgi:hypothetical protein